MKQTLILILALVALQSAAQIKGKGKWVSYEIPTADILEVNIQMYADIIIDGSQSAGLKVEIEENLWPYVDREVVDGVLTLDQMEWIEPTKRPIIRIGAPNIRKLELGTHDQVQVTRLDVDKFHVLAPIGKAKLEGKVNHLSIASEMGNIEASALQVQSARVEIWESGSATVNVLGKLETKIGSEGRLYLASEPAEMNGNARQVIARSAQEKDLDIHFFNLAIQNNSLRKGNYYVVGPKRDGSKFSYGFAMRPMQTKKERWTNGTKVYEVSKLGLRKLIATIEKTDQNQTVKLYSKS